MFTFYFRGFCVHYSYRKKKKKRQMKFGSVEGLTGSRGYSAVKHREQFLGQLLGGELDPTAI